MRECFPGGGAPCATTPARPRCPTTTTRSSPATRAATARWSAGPTRRLGSTGTDGPTRTSLVCTQRISLHSHYQYSVSSLRTASSEDESVMLPTAAQQRGMSTCMRTGEVSRCHGVHEMPALLRCRHEAAALPLRGSRIKGRAFGMLLLWMLKVTASIVAAAAAWLLLCCCSVA